MEKDKEKWNKKYLENKNIPTNPSDIVVKFASIAKVGKALDVACGNGRNSFYLQKLGFEVDAVDISDVAIDYIKYKNKNINAFVSDLDEFRPEKNKYDLIININFLDRRLFPYLKEALKSQGIIIFETFLLTDKSNTKDFYLRKNELIYNFIDFHILYYEEKETTKHTGEKAKKASIVAKKEC